MDVESEDLVEDQKELVAILYHFGIPSIPYIFAACVALLLYEHALTFADEYRVIWRRKLSIPTCLFILNRYGALVYILGLLLWGYVHWGEESNQGCDFSGVMQFIAVFGVGLGDLVFVALRIHVINARNRFWTTVIIMLGLTTVPLNIILMIRNENLPMPEPIMGCGNKARVSNLGDDALWTKIALTFQLVYIAFTIFLFLKPVIVTLITWYRTYEAVRASRGSHMQPTFAYLLLRDGRPWSNSNADILRVRDALAIDSALLTPAVDARTSSIFFSRAFSTFAWPKLPRPPHHDLRPSRGVDPVRRETLEVRQLLDNISAPLSVGEEDADLPDEDVDEHGREWASEPTADGDLDATSGVYQKIAFVTSCIGIENGLSMLLLASSARFDGFDTNASEA
ncbi:uncharacterized protein BXZ73DRAFT_81084 [Epithele typhae]|uniref:uncharacterized protein n=1 Tax=Epithele typhae TaxID=378194 RepID=UPI00200813F1|nr:uncharacterized protein BXZ73DRAFT_81084 [Epithele typhae]KAH9916400.1 hypothetical protein BXZ73DRAFT_81084 [Epithele typhae]